MTLVESVNILLSLLIILSQLWIAAAIVYLVFFRNTSNIVFDFFSKHGILFAFIVALVATSGSLFYSQFAGFAPCELCWFQRIFMYPEVILLGIALLKKDTGIINYALPLAVIGGIISLNHNYLYYGDGGLMSSCQLGGAVVSCVKRYVFEFGYVTIPMMALTGFALIIIFLMLAYREKYRVAP